jgi:hypothetical protein
MRWLLIALAVAGCAKGGPGNSIIGGLEDAGVDGGSRDAGDPPEPDASPIDAPPAQVTLAQTVTGAMLDGNSVACQPELPGATRANSYYRVFALADHAIAGALHVTEVAFAIEAARSAVGLDQPATLRIGTYGGTPFGETLDLAQIQPLNSVPLRIADGRLTRMTVPVAVDIPAGANLIVELALPADPLVENEFFIGTNRDGERRPGYLRAPECEYDDPTTFVKIASDSDDRFGPVAILLTVTGTVMEIESVTATRGPM